MDTEKLLRDFKVFCLVSLFYLILLAIFCALKIRNRRKKQSPPYNLKDELKNIFANKNFTYLFAAVYLFTAMYAVKNVVIRVVFIFIYFGFIAKMVKNDLDKRNK